MDSEALKNWLCIALNGFKLEVLEAVVCSQLSLSHHHDFISTAFASCVRLCIIKFVYL